MPVNQINQPQPCHSAISPQSTAAFYAHTHACTLPGISPPPKGMLSSAHVLVSAVVLVLLAGLPGPTQAAPEGSPALISNNDSMGVVHPRVMSSNGSLLLTVGPALDVGFTVGDRYTSLPAMQTVVASLGAGQEKLRGDLVAVEQKLGKQLSSLQGQVDADVGAVEQKLDDEVSSLQGQVDADVGELEALRQIVSSLQTTVASLAALPAARRVHPIACSNDTPPAPLAPTWLPLIWLATRGCLPLA